MAIRHNVTHNFLDGLLSVLNDNIPEAKLPKNAKTLLRTPRKCCSIIEMYPGQYLHLGVEWGVERYLLSNPEAKSVEHIKLIVGIDGLPLAKSSGSELWPILGSVSRMVTSL